MKIDKWEIARLFMAFAILWIGMVIGAVLTARDFQKGYATWDQGFEAARTACDELKR